MNVCTSSCKATVILSKFSNGWHVSTYFTKLRIIKVYENSPSVYGVVTLRQTGGRTNEWTDLTKLTRALQQFICSKSDKNDRRTGRGYFTITSKYTKNILIQV
jgi:hypothetical protein